MIEKIIIAIAPYLLDIIVDIFKAEKDPEKDTHYGKHDYVMQNFAKKIKKDRAFKEFTNHDIMKVMNIQIKDTVKRFNDEGIFQRSTHE
jgi:hypothetical protein